MIGKILKDLIWPRNSPRVPGLLDRLQTFGITILTPPHTLYLAHLLMERLRRLEFLARIHVGEFKGDFQESLFIVLCPQVFKKVPDSYIAFQMEQGSGYWFDEHYLDRLRNPKIRILDYSSRNVPFLIRAGIDPERVRVGQLCPFWDYLSFLRDQGHLSHAVPEKEYDVFFYGGINERRFHFLSKINEKFKMKVAVGVFGAPLYDLILKSKVLVNLHVNDYSLLESTRIFESLSMKAKVVSEPSKDLEDYSGLERLVNFSESNQPPDIIETVRHLLDQNEIQKEEGMSKYENATADQFSDALVWAMKGLGWLRD